MGRVDIDAYEIKGRLFKAQFSGYCGIDEEHEVRRGDKVARVRLKANPLVTLPGVACKACVRDMPRGWGG